MHSGSHTYHHANAHAFLHSYPVPDADCESRPHAHIDAQPNDDGDLYQDSGATSHSNTRPANSDLREHRHRPPYAVDIRPLRTG